MRVINNRGLENGGEKKRKEEGKRGEVLIARGEEREGEPWAPRKDVRIKQPTGQFRETVLTRTEQIRWSGDLNFPDWNFAISSWKSRIARGGCNRNLF